MKKIFILVCLLFAGFMTKAQLSEKHLKLNRIVVLDSAKSLTFTSSSTPKLAFVINVPSNTYWKLNRVCLSNALGTTGPRDNLYVNTANFRLLTYPNSIGIGEGDNCLLEAPLFLSPNSQLLIYSTYTSSSVPFTTTKTLFLNAEEYFLE